MKLGKTGPTDVLRKGEIACETRGKREGVKGRTGLVTLYRRARYSEGTKARSYEKSKK